MSTHEHDLRKRTKDFALRIIRMVASLPKSTVAQTGVLDVEQLETILATCGDTG